MLLYTPFHTWPVPAQTAANCLPATAPPRAMTKLTEIVAAEGRQRGSAHRVGVGADTYFSRGRDGALVSHVDEFGDDTDHDSMDLMVGRPARAAQGRPGAHLPHLPYLHAPCPPHGMPNIGLCALL